jgi:hypothetical protein
MKKGRKKIDDYGNKWKKREKDEDGRTKYLVSGEVIYKHLFGV